MNREPPDPLGSGRTGEAGNEPPDAVHDREYWLRRHRRLPPLRAVGYRSKSSRFNRWMYRARRRTTSALLDRLVGRGAAPLRVLDVGSGSGFYVELWSERSREADLAGIDVSPQAVDELRERFPRWEFHVAELGGRAELPVSGRFDLIECFDVLYHITDDAAFRRGLAELAARVRPGGYLIVTDNLPARDVTTRRHVRLRSIETYLDVLTDFRTVAVVPQFLLLNVPSGIVPGWIRWPMVVAWEGLTWPARFEPIGDALGAALYGLDRVLLRVTGGRTPSTKLVAFQRAVDARGT